MEMVEFSSGLEFMIDTFEKPLLSIPVALKKIGNVIAGFVPSGFLLQPCLCMWYM